MFGLAEEENETRHDGIRQSSTGKAADHPLHLRRRAMRDMKADHSFR